MKIRSKIQGRKNRRPADPQHGKVAGAPTHKKRCKCHNQIDFAMIRVTAPVTVRQGVAAGRDEGGALGEGPEAHRAVEVQDRHPEGRDAAGRTPSKKLGDRNAARERLGPHAGAGFLNRVETGLRHPTEKHSHGDPTCNLR